MGLPMVWHDPVGSTWSLGARPSSAAMDFFGRTLWAMAAALCAWAASYRLRSLRATRVSVAIAAATMAACLGLEVQRLATRVPVAEEFPPGYEAVTGRIDTQTQPRLARH